MRPRLRATTAAITLCLIPIGAWAQDPVLLQAILSSPVPAARPALPLVPVVAEQSFSDWIADFQRTARRAGITDQTFALAFASVRYQADIIALDRNQAEFSKPLWEYLDGAVSADRIRTGRAMLQRHGQLLDAIERRYGVEKEVTVAIWGLESSFGGYRGRTPVISALATLAYDGRRGAFFEEQLLAALQIIQAGDIQPDAMIGSWAGAMGHTQFMPTSFLDYAVDITGDGRRDIWSDNPADALASTAAYLARHGWRSGESWGVEVRLPQGFDIAQTGREVSRSTAAWARRGVRMVSGAPLPELRRASIVLPAGVRGPALMVFRNFDVIEKYNAADSYVIAVGHLSDRLRGGPAIQQPWPRGDRPLAVSERKELQARLTAAGFSTQGADGRIGPNTVAAIRAYQRSAGLPPDGYASAGLLDDLR